MIGHGGSEAVEGRQENCEQAPTGNSLATLLWRLLSRQFREAHGEKSTEQLPFPVECRFLADSVAKVPKCLATNFPLKDKPSDNR
jgi:hypothetical protein